MEPQPLGQLKSWLQTHARCADGEHPVRLLRERLRRRPSIEATRDPEAIADAASTCLRRKKLSRGDEMANEIPDREMAQPATWRELEKLRKNWEELAARVAEIESNAKDREAAPPALDFDDEKLAAIASSIYAARKRRTELFDPALFGEPAWDMLLILFISKARGEQLSTSILCSRSSTPHATGLRWIERLQEKELVTRQRASGDSRVMWVEITATGYRLMRRYVIGGIARFQMPLPD